MKIYTRTGDDGTTGLFGAGRVPKDHPRIQACGLVDETNATLGMALARMWDADADAVGRLLSSIQHDLFDLGADIATPSDTRAAVPRITLEHVRRLELAIDRHEEALEPLKNFILPGGVPAAATLHLVRTVCRRAERQLVALARSEGVNSLALQYLNRLSDLLFVLARRVNALSGAGDTLWIHGTARGHDLAA